MLLFFMFDYIIFNFIKGLSKMLIIIFGLNLNLLSKNFLIICWFYFYLNILMGYLSYCGVIFFSFDFFMMTIIWVLSMYFFWMLNYSFFISLVEESNFIIMFFIFLIELLSKFIQFFTILIRLLVNFFFGECIKILMVYNNFFFFYFFFGLLEFFILFIQSLIFYYMFIYYCNE
uniref:ATP synthase F0 subunit 6 n=1 Tax=Meloidogyne oryzae TaxID=325757 RepID=A0A481X5S1_9BILA|nr:ATP synthase F0 subunit 6 [Meloidogyne oryzae]